MNSIVFLVSGSGGNFKFFYLAMKKSILMGARLIVIADRECGAINFARKNEIENHLILYKRSDPAMLDKILKHINPDVIVTNWDKIIDADTVNQYRGKFVNLHYSLLPAFGGLIGTEPIKRAYEQGCKYIGPTCHLVDEGVDTGKIIAQAVFTTDRPFEDAVSLMFRHGCLVLLNGIQQILTTSLLPVHSEKSHLSITPANEFDESLFDEKFWNELAAV